MRNIKVIGFDADDTLWENETYYHEAEKLLCELLKDYTSAENISSELLRIEINNMNIYGYGVKAFTLSMIETALIISKNQISQKTIAEILGIGKELLKKPILLLDNVEKILKQLKGNYKLIVATKGDLLDQQRKLDISGLTDYFDHIEIMNDKNETEYKKLLDKLNIKVEEFLMVGNSLKSDILPIVAIGAKAIHVPFYVTWKHETITSEFNIEHIVINNFNELPNVLNLCEYEKQIK